MLLHLHVGGREVTDVIKIFSVDVSVKCGISFSDSELHQLSYVSTPEVGNFFEPSLNKKRSPLQRLIDRHPRSVRILDECYDADGYLPIHSAALGGNLVAIKWFKNVGVNMHLKTRDGLTALDISIFCLKNDCGKNERSSERYRKKCFEEVLRAYLVSLHKKYSSDFPALKFPSSNHPILHKAAGIGLDVLIDVYDTALEIIPGLKKRKYLLLNQQDENGNTPLHIAAIEGIKRSVKYLVGLGADISIKNNDNRTPVLLALLTVPVHSIKSYVDHRCYTTDDGLFTSCATTPHDEIARYLISFQKLSISNCDDNNAFLLTAAIEKRMPLSLYALLKNGVDVNCQHNEWSSPFLKHLRIGGQEISEVFQIFEVNISVQCGTFFAVSELHLISHKSASNDFGNFFEPSLNKKRSPMQRLIDSHPRGVRVLDECYDAEGYLPIHRAAQGGNLVAIKWFKNVENIK